MYLLCQEFYSVSKGNLEKNSRKKAQDLRQKAEILRIFGGRPYGMGKAPRKAPPYSVMTMRTVAR